jgi:hypothetical protein
VAVCSAGGGTRCGARLCVAVVCVCGEIRFFGK